MKFRNEMKKKLVIFVCILGAMMAAGYRIQKIRAESDRRVHNMVRIHAEYGAPHDYVIAKTTTDVLLEPLFVQNGRALVSSLRVGRFVVGDKINGKKARITTVSKNIDLDTGMFVVRVSGNISGEVYVEKRHTGFFLPIDAVLPPNARVIARDSDRVVVLGLSEGDKIVVR
jgi:hypothetical protein